MRIASFLILAGVSGVWGATGEESYKQHCSGCHESGAELVPTREALGKLAAARIERALEFGSMMAMAARMTRPERKAVAEFLGRAGGDGEPSPAAYCASRGVKIGAKTAMYWNGWSPAADNMRYVPEFPREKVRGLRLRWAFGFDGETQANGHPAVIGDVVILGSPSGELFALEASSGCIRWRFQGLAPIRTAPVVTPSGREYLALVGDQIGWLYAVDAATGKERWRKRVDEHEATRLTGPAVVVGDLVIIGTSSWEERRAMAAEYACCTFRGSMSAFRVSDGSLVWKTYLTPEAPRETGVTPSGVKKYGPSGVGVWSAAAVDRKRKLLYVGTGDNYSHPATAWSDAIVALDTATGKVRWAKQMLAGDVWNGGCNVPGSANCPEGAGPDFDFGAPVVIVTGEDGKDILLAGQKSGMVYGLDPDKEGAIVWQARAGKGSTIGGVQWGMASDGQRLYVAVSDVVRTRHAAKGPGDTRALDVDPNLGGGLTAYRVKDGEKIWYATPEKCAGGRPGCSPAQSAAVTAVAGAVLAGSVDGHLRAYDSETGKVIWDYDTAKEFKTVNGVKARGGSIDGPGPVAGGRMVFVNSGYARFGGMAGNVLLAFGVD